MELLFSNQHKHTVTVPRYFDPSLLSASPVPPSAPIPTTGDKTTIKFLIWWLREYLLADRQRPELFSQGDSMYALSHSCLPRFAARPLPCLA